MDKIETLNKLAGLKAELLKHISLKRMFLFGSYAQDRQRPDSDIDVAIVVDKIQGDYLKYITFIWKLSAKYDTRIEPVVFEEGQPDLSGFFGAIIKNGLEIS
jgi:uncharacterized protein